MSINRSITASAAILAAGAMSLTACSSGGGSAGQSGQSGDSVELTVTANAISGGKNAAEADWMANWVIPKFEAAQKEAGKDVTVKFIPQGVDDENYKTKIALDFKSGKGADIVSLDGIWVGEFAQAGYIKPLKDIAGAAVESWDGWKQIPEAVQGAVSFNGSIYGVPTGADGRVLYYNKDLFKKAGLGEDWNPTSWNDVLETARTLKKLEGVTPIQLNAGTAMGEATTMQGVLPLLAGTGTTIWGDGKWMGDTQGLEKVLNLYKTIYVDEGLGDPILQQEASGRDTSFSEFSEGKIGILLEGDYFWRSVINPAEGVGTAPMKDRDTVVGYTKIPAMEPGSGVKGQDFVSMGGGAGRVLNPNSQNPEMAWELLTFMNSADAYEARAAGSLSISPRTDVNDKLLSSDKMLSFVSENILPLNSYRPGLAEYPEVSTKLQQATLDVVTGTSVADAAKSYQDAVTTIVGADAVSGK